MSGPTGPTGADGFRRLAPDLVTIQESIVADHQDQVVEILGPGYHVVHQADREGQAGDRLVRDLFGLHKLEEAGGVEFYLPHGERIRLLRDCGLEIDGLIEVQAPAGGVNQFISEISLEWARRWPSEEIWFARRR